MLTYTNTGSTTELYILFAETFLANATGAYTLTIQ